MIVRKKIALTIVPIMTLGYLSAAFAADNLSTIIPGTAGGSQQQQSNANQNQNSGGLTYDPLTSPDSNIGSIKPSDSPESAILSQTVYLAQLVKEARNTLPPTYYSTRANGSALPYATSNIKNVKNQISDAWLQYYMGSKALRYNQGNNQDPVQAFDPTGRTTTDTTSTNYPLTSTNSEQNLLKSLLLSRASSGYCGGFENNIKTVDMGNTTLQQACSANRYVNDPYADLAAGSLFAPDITNSQAALRYIQNITGMLPTAVPKDLLKSGNDQTVGIDTAGPQLVNWYATNAQKSMAQDALLSIYSDHMASPYLAIPKKYVPGQNLSDLTKDQLQVTSPYGLLKFEATKRFENPRWYDNLQSMPQDAVLKEMAMMMATQLELNEKMYAQNQYLVGLIAMQTSATAGIISQVQAGQARAKAETTPAKIIGNLTSALRSQPGGEAIADTVQKQADKLGLTGDSSGSDSGSSSDPLCNGLSGKAATECSTAAKQADSSKECKDAPNSLSCIKEKAKQIKKVVNCKDSANKNAVVCAAD